MDTEVNRTKAELAESFAKSVKQAIRIASGEKLGTGAEEWIAELCKEAEAMKDANRIL